MSRIRKNSAVRAAEGDRGNRAKKGALGVAEYDRREIELPGSPEMPEGLSAEARKFWHQTVPLLMRAPGLLSVVDGAVIGDLCEVRANKKAIQQGMHAAVDQAVEDAKARSAASRRKVKPKVNVAAVRALTMIEFTRALNQLLQRESVLRQQLGMSPLARTQIKLPPILNKTPILTEADADDSALDSALMGDNLMRV